MQVEARRGDRREARLERLREAEEEVRVERRIEAGGLVRVRPRDRDAAPLAPDEDAAVRVDRHRDHGRQVEAGSAHEDMPAHGLDGDVDARESRDAPRERPGRDHDGSRLDGSGAGRQAEARCGVRDSRHARAVERPDAGAGRLAEEEVREAARVDEAVARAERPAEDLPGRERGFRAHSRRIEDLDGDAARALERRGGSHRGEPLRVARQEEVARLAVHRRVADLAREAVEDLHRREGHRDVDVRRELRADAAVRLRGRARPGEGLLLEEEDARRPEPRELEGDARADDSRSDDRDVRALRHADSFSPGDRRLSCPRKTRGPRTGAAASRREQTAQTRAGTMSSAWTSERGGTATVGRYAGFHIASATAFGISASGIARPRPESRATLTTAAAMLALT